MNLTPSFRSTWALTAAFALFLGCQAQSDVATVDESTVPAETKLAERSPNAMPDFSLPDLDGNHIKLSDHADKVVLVNFWATTCPPCRHEMPDFVDIQNEYGGDMFTIIGISLDLGGEERVSQFVDDYQLNFPIVMGNRDVVIDYGNIRGIPTTFILNKDHELVGKRVGMVTREMITPIIDSLIKL
jgi:thiol-disulfide isomerase/thioredoxin